jgi:hypothetical protein
VGRPLAGRPLLCDREEVSRTAILLWILALLALEVQHLKWIWWEYWDCRRCSAKHKDCACGATHSWVMFL